MTHDMNESYYQQFLETFRHDNVEDRLLIEQVRRYVDYNLRQLERNAESVASKLNSGGFASLSDTEKKTLENFFVNQIQYIAPVLRANLAAASDFQLQRAISVDVHSDLPLSDPVAEELRMRVRDLEQRLNLVLRLFTSDLRTPIANIRAGLQILQFDVEKLSSEQQGDMPRVIQLVQYESERMVDMLDDTVIAERRRRGYAEPPSPSE